jgi:hypothetical protein
LLAQRLEALATQGGKCLFTLPEKLPLAAGRVSFIRRVRSSGRITLLNEKFFVGRRRRGQYVWATIFTKRQQL